MRILFTALCFLLLSVVQSQSLKLSGKVVNEKNESVAGVSIRATNGEGTATDVSGNFSLNLSAGQKYELSFSAVGYVTKTISDIEVVNGQVNELNVVLATVSKDLSNVVVSANRSNARRESINLRD